MRLKIALLSLLVAGNAYGITLDEAVKTALERNNQLKAQKIEVKEKQYDYKAAKAHLLPKVELFTNYNKTTDPPYAIMNRMEVKKLDMYNTDFNDPGKSQLFKTGLKVEVPIWMGGKIRTAVDLTKKEVKAAKERLKRDENRVILDVVKAYYGVLTAKAFVETAQLAVRDAERHLKDAETVYKAGVGLKSDVLRAKVYLEQMRENLVKAQSAYQVALRALNVAMGLYPNSEITVEGDLTYRPYSFNLNSLIEEALKNRPELKELQVRYQQTKDLEKLAKAEFLPHIGAFGEVFAADSKVPWDKENSSWMVGFQATINLFNGGAKFYKLRKSKLASLKVKEYQEQAKKGIAFEVSKAYYDFLSAQKRVELAKAAIESAQESLRIVETRYKNGLATITELLDTQTALNQARSNYVAALSNYRMAVAQVYYAAGLLPKRYDELVQ
ncbi:TolC family protein [Thermovibrio ammonificans]|uniref:Outer membrane efflux protein n=1 Tax=Thermovibrio ammonificans (strain DSM 15698 / JCM 12110 / HB-1) TaxID=648996 RepID=E8T3A7_THEA1|nr:TolC family protein [Thermovibrio ammonificans]ADU97239.1 outer membrane efflux protein [Thermovibrio ammonificans HB-1]